MKTFASSISKVFYGTLIHSRSIKEIEYIKQGLLFIDDQGKIAKLVKGVAHDKVDASLEGVASEKVVHLHQGQFIIPGFIDTHIHAPQYTFCGNGHDLPLLEWLDTYTFPRESKFQDAEYARKLYTKSGQRAYVGKVNMNQNSPDFLVETTESSVRDTRAFIDYVKEVNTGNNSPLVTPIITPRFAISCDSELLTELGKLAAEYDLPIQSHLCENLNEIGFTMSLFPNSANYTSVYADHGLLNDRTIMAHCVHMKDEELDLMKEKNAGISHCANSTFNLKSGMADVRKMLNKDIKVGLGTDVAGGYSPSILEALRSSRTASVARNMETSLIVAELFYLATVGGARVMELDDKIGNFEVGKEFDAILVNTQVENTPMDVFDHDSVETQFEKYLFVGDDRNNEKIYVQGKEVRLPGAIAAPRK
ncbi:hypothetical protein CPC16_001740 [Podila verticillata]|nr:hypothetical protein CPC16_001740 [Podila verticillata]